MLIHSGASIHLLVVCSAMWPYLSNLQLLVVIVVVFGRFRPLCSSSRIFYTDCEAVVNIPNGLLNLLRNFFLAEDVKKDIQATEDKDKLATMYKNRRIAKAIYDICIIVFYLHLLGRNAQFGFLAILLALLSLFLARIVIGVIFLTRVTLLFTFLPAMVFEWRYELNLT